MERWNIMLNPLSRKEETQDEWSRANVVALSEVPGSTQASSSTPELNKGGDLDIANYSSSSLRRSPEHDSEEFNKNTGKDYQDCESSTDSSEKMLTSEATETILIMSSQLYTAFPIVLLKALNDNDETTVPVAYASKAIRLAFLRKVYGLLAMQIFITVCIGILFMYTPPIRKFIAIRAWVILPVLFGSMLILIPLYYYRRKVPVNFILLVAFVICQAITIGVVVTFFSEAVVLVAFSTTLLVFGGLSLYTLQSEYDYSGWYSFLFACLTILIVAGSLQMVMPSRTRELLISYGGALLFCLYIIVDLSIIMKHLSPEEYIYATITLYLDILNLFIHLLREH